jgi:hypothetical protein
MSRLILANEQIRIYDDFLPQEAFEALLHHATLDSYAIVHRDEWCKVWRLGDGLPLHGTTTYYRADASLHEDHETLRYPSGTPLDAFIDGVNAVAGEAAGIVGETWAGMTVTSWVYPLGSGMSLHRIGDTYTGSYAYFVHREWNFHWGGQLLILDPRTGNGDRSDWLSGGDETRAGMEPGLATCILPKPNRLVFIAPGVQHMITRVDVNAGNHPRVTLAGYFLRCECRG